MSDLRTRLGLGTMMNLAELRLHLRDEHVRKNTKRRLKAHFGMQVERPQLPENITPMSGKV